MKFFDSPWCAILGVGRAFRFADKIELLLVFGHKRPVGIIWPDRRIYLEPPRKLDEQLDVFVAVEVLRKLPLNLRLVFDRVE